VGQTVAQEAAQGRGIAVIEGVERLGLAGSHLAEELQLLSRAARRRGRGTQPLESIVAWHKIFNRSYPDFREILSPAQAGAARWL
jgi:hypothetical protein